MNLLAIDYGKKFIGLALGNDETKLSMPLSIVENRNIEYIIREIKNLVEYYKVKKIIVGKANWHNNKQNEFIEAFVDDLKKNISGINYEWIDESLTSQAVKSLPNIKVDASRIDDLSAMLILQSYLESKKSNV